MTIAAVIIAIIVLRAIGTVLEDRRAISESSPPKPRAIELPAPSFPELYARGLKKHSEGDFDGAIEEFTRVLEQNPRHADAFNSRGISRQAKGNLVAAVADYTKAIDIDWKFSQAFYNRGNVRRLQKDLDGAIEDHTTALRLDPGFASPYASRGAARHDKGDLEGAIEDATRSITLSPSATAYTNRAIARRDQGDLQAAIGDATRAIELDPGYAMAYTARGVARGAGGDLSGAVADYGLSLGVDPKLTATYRERGYVRYVLGAWKDAIEDFTTACSLDPADDAYPCLWLYLARARLGEIGPDRDLRTRLPSWKRQSPQGEHTRIAAFLIGELAESEFLKETPANELASDVPFYLGSGHLLRGNKERAIEWFRKGAAGEAKEVTILACKEELKRLDPKD